MATSNLYLQAYSSTDADSMVVEKELFISRSAGSTITFLFGVPELLMYFFIGIRKSIISDNHTIKNIRSSCSIFDQYCSA